MVVVEVNNIVVEDNLEEEDIADSLLLVISDEEKRRFLSIHNAEPQQITRRPGKLILRKNKQYILLY